MSVGTVFINNRTQAVRLPLDVRLPEGNHKVEIRARGNERIITPLGQTWDSFFLDGPKVSDDFLPERAKVAQHYGAIRAALEKLGQPIGVNGLHITGHARSEDLVLVTNNTSEFVRVPALEVDNWVHTDQ